MAEPKHGSAEDAMARAGRSVDRVAESAKHLARDSEEEAKEKVVIKVTEQQLRDGIKVVASVAAFALVVAAGFRWGPWVKDKGEELEEDLEDALHRGRRKFGRKAGEVRRKAGEVADETYEGAQETSHGVGKTLHDIAGGVKHKLHDAGEAVGHKAGAVRSKASGALTTAEDKVAGAAQDTKHAAGETAQRAGHGAKETWNWTTNKAEETEHAAEDAVGRAANRARWGKADVQRKGERVGHRVGERGEEFGDTVEEKRTRAKHEAERRGCTIM